MKTVFVAVLIVCASILSAIPSIGADSAPFKASVKTVALLDKTDNASSWTTAISTGDNVTSETLRKFALRGETVAFDNGTFGVGGFVRLRYENVKYLGEWSSYLRSYVDLNLENMGTPGLSLHFYGSMQNSLKNADESLDLYYGYIRYKTFQNAIDVKAGRFELINNSFMTVDGGEASFITPAYLGITLYGGVPSYKNFEDRKVVFRNTGDLVYGGRIFLSGIENVHAYIGYSLETGRGDSGSFSVFSESLGAGGFYKYDLSSAGLKSYLTVGADVEYDPHNGVMSRLSGRFDYKYDFFGFKVFGDIFDVKDQYPQGRELIIQLLSNGSEKRLGGDVSFDISDIAYIYAGLYATNLQLKNDRSLNGMVYKGGFEINLMKEAHLTLGGEVYYYDTWLFDAAGGMLSVDWRISRDFALNISGEMAGMLGAGKPVTAYSVDTELKIYLLKGLEAAVYFGKGENNRFVDDIRCGLTVKYAY